MHSLLPRHLKCQTEGANRKIRGLVVEYSLIAPKELFSLRRASRHGGQSEGACNEEEPIYGH